MLRALVGGICIGAARSGRAALTRRRHHRHPRQRLARPHRGWAWRASFVLGLIVAGAIAAALEPAAVAGPSVSWPLALVAGLLVGFGTRYGGGCTSGHGVCGVGRLSRRSIVGCGMFVAVAMVGCSSSVSGL